MKKSSFFLLLFCYTLNSIGQVWTPVGPAPQNSRSFGPVSGRVWDISISPAYTVGAVNNPAMMFIAPDRGGIWRSRDFTSAAPHWEPLFDNLQQLFWAEKITVDPNEPNRLLVPAGKKMILVSENSGTTWDTLAGNVFGGAGPGLQVIIDPTQTDNNTMYGLDGASNWGSDNVFRTRNGGANWDLLNFPVSRGKAGLDFTVSQTNQLSLYTGLKMSGIWHSGNGGDTWTKMSIELRDITTGMLVDSSVIGRISFAADHRPGTANGIYAIITNSNSSHILNIFRLIGATWRPIATNLQQAENYVSASNHGINSSSTFQAIGLADNGFLYAAAGDPQYSPVYQKRPADTKWYSIENFSDHFRPHVDIHSLVFYDSRMYAGTDGGIYRFTPRANNEAGTSIWESLNTSSLQTQLVEGVGIHPTNPDIILIGTWDNAIGRKENGVWTEPFGGDNAKILFDPASAGDKQYAYTTGVGDYSFFFRSEDGGKTWADNSPPDIRAREAHVDWYAPFAIHPVDPKRIVIGIDRVYESKDNGAIGSWGVARSPIFAPAGTRPVTMRPFGSQATAIAYGHSDVIWVAYGGNLFRTSNAGGNGSMANWNAMNNGVNFGGSIIKIVVDPVKPNDIFLAVNNNSIWKRQFFVSIAGSPGWGWVNITSNLPNSVSVNTLSLVPATTSRTRGLFVGTSAGMYMSTDNGFSWRSFNNGLPRGDVKDIQYYAPGNLLYAGLYGRGVYRTAMNDVLDRNKQPGITILQKKGDCDLSAVAGSTIRIGFQISNHFSNIVSIKWTIDNAITEPDETFDRREIAVTVPSSTPNIGAGVEVEFADGVKLAKYLQLPTHTQDEASAFYFFCNLRKERKKPIPWWQWNPRMWEWDSKVNEVIRKKVTKEELIREKKEVEDYLKLLRREIEMYK